MRPTLMVLEDRRLLSTIVVNNPTDTPVTGQTDLREAIVQANTTGGGETIDFDGTVFDTPQTITLSGTQLELSDTTGTETITGPATGVTVSGGGLSRVFQVDRGVGASISGMTISGGNSYFKPGGYLGNGGGLFNSGLTSLTNCTVSGNSASFGGGGLYNNGQTVLLNCTVSGNSASSGGGVDTERGVINLYNCTVAGNSGGGVSNFNGRAYLTNCTVSGNSATFGGGGLYNSGTATLTNTIIAGNTAESGASDISGSALGNNNLFGNGGSGGLVNGVAGNIVGVANPLLAPVGDYGGPTQTMPLLPGSPAIGMGTAVSVIFTDQRGEPLDSPPDIGAFQSQGFTLTPVAGSTPQTSQVGTRFAIPLAVSVTANNPIEPVNGGVVRFANTATQGALAMLSAPSAVIGGGQAAATAAPNDVDGSYAVVASASGSSPVVSFALTNNGPVFASLVVNTTSDSLAPGAGLLSLREAIGFNDTAPSGNSNITFDSTVFNTAKTIALTGAPLELSNTTETETITGPAAGVTVDGGGLSRVFQVDVSVTASISGLTISGGNAGNGAGLFNSGTTTLTNCTVSGNSASQNGGGLYNNGTTTLTNCTVSGNSARYGGGLDNPNGTTKLTDVTVSGNSANFGGGGVANLGSLTVDDSTFDANEALYGGAIYNQFGHIDLLDSGFTDNSAGNTGGAVSNSSGGSGSISGCNFSGNHAGLTGGGGISVFGGALTIANTTITGNSSAGNAGGGGLLVAVGSATLTNCTVSGDSAGGNGGGVTNESTTTLTNCTVSGNSATNIGGGIYSNSAATSTLNNTIVAANLDGNGTPEDIDGAVASSSSHNLIGVDTNLSGISNGSNGNQVGTAAAPINPMLGSLQDNGGPTETMALLPGSPAIDAGSNALAVDPVTNQPLTYDQRGAGFLRVLGSAVDIGAFEAPVPVTASNLQAAIATLPTGGTLFIQADSTQISSDLSAVNGLSAPTAPVSVTLDLGSQTTSLTTPINAPTGVQVVLTSSSTSGATVSGATVNGGNVLVGAGVTPSNWTVNGGNVTVEGSAAAGDFIVNGGTVTLADGTVITGNSPAIIVNGGTVILQAATAQTATNSPTIVVSGGSLLVRDSTIEGSTGYPQPAILITGGTVDLGTSTRPGGNTINVNGTAELVNDTTSSSVPDVGNTLEVNGTALAGPYLSFTALTGSTASSVYGQSVTFTATVRAASPTDGTPTGTVDFVDTTTGANLGTRTVTNGVAALSTSALAVGNHTITADYQGDNNFAFSLGSATCTVQQDGSTTTVSSSAGSPALGQTLTFTAKVAANAPGSGTPTGTVDFFDTTTKTDLTPGGVPLSSGTATFSTRSLTAGSHTIQASYSGDTNFLTSSASTGTITVGQSIIVLDPSAAGALSLSTNASIKVAGGVYVDSSSSSALSVSGNAAITASVIDVHGGVQKSGNASFSPAPVTGAATVPDPLASLPAPSTSGLTSYGAESLSGNSSATIKPGVYTGITVSGNAKLTMNSGIYIIEGGGFTVSGTASVSGPGVLIVNAGSSYPNTGGTYGSITLSSAGSYNLSPPTTGTYAGIVIFQSRDNTKALTVSANASALTGTIYAPAAQVAESGNAQLNAAIIADTMTIGGNGVADVVVHSAPSGPVASTPAPILDTRGLTGLGDGTVLTTAIVDNDWPTYAGSAVAPVPNAGRSATSSGDGDLIASLAAYDDALDQWPTSRTATSKPSSSPARAARGPAELAPALTISSVVNRRALQAAVVDALLAEDCSSGRLLETCPE